LICIALLKKKKSTSRRLYTFLNYIFAMHEIVDTYALCI